MKYILSLYLLVSVLVFFFFFNDTATTEIYTLSLHDALPISAPAKQQCVPKQQHGWHGKPRDRKSTRLNSSHLGISYAVFCLKKTNKRLAHCSGIAGLAAALGSPRARTPP